MTGSLTVIARYLYPVRSEGSGLIGVENGRATMSMPQLYQEGLTQRALLGEDRLNAYKLGVIEAILKEALRHDTAGDREAFESHVRMALDVVRWEMPRKK